MSRSRKHHPDGKPYKVGYCRPPEATRFKAGSSGNPTGRPRRRKTLTAIIDETLAKRVSIEEKGRSRKVSIKEIIIRRLTNAAAKGDLKAVQLVLRLIERYQDPMAIADAEKSRVRKEGLQLYYVLVGLYRANEGVSAGEDGS